MQQMLWQTWTTTAGLHGFLPLPLWGENIFDNKIRKSCICICFCVYICICVCIIVWRIFGYSNIFRREYSFVSYSYQNFIFVTLWFVFHLYLHLHVYVDCSHWQECTGHAQSRGHPLPEGINCEGNAGT